MDRKQKIWLAVLAGYIMVIYGHSLMPAVQSSAESGFVLELARSALESLGISSGWLTEHIVRKSAHFTEYAGMGFLLYQNLNVWRASLEYKRLAGVLAVLGVPFLDETIQLFVEGRSGMIQDVWLDMSGAVCGLILAAVLAVLWSRIRRKH